MATKRKAISKKTRFEVFKRDGFKCMYCGAEAPKVVLNVDHIKPVADGGKNDLLNLISACEACNSGKSATPLSDESAVQKQRAQLEELQVRREQMEMMLSWRDSMKSICDDELERVQRYFNQAIPGWHIQSDGAVKNARQFIKKYGLQATLDAIDTAVEAYVKRDKNGKVVAESAEVAWQKVGGVLRLNSLSEDQKRLYYIRGIVRNRMYMSRYLMDDLKLAARVGVHIDDIEHEARTARNWTQFNQWLQAAISEREGME